MFNVCRRASASVSRRIAASAISRSAVCKQSILPLGTGKLSQSIIICSNSFHSSPLHNQYDGAAASPIQEGEGESSELITRFQDLADKGMVHETVIDRIVNGMGYENMTMVQSMTINESLKGTDMIAQAKTGTGKTLGFLIPVVQNILRSSPELSKPSRQSRNASASDIRAIIMSPTRELATQIAVEAEKLVSGTGLKVQVAVGGNNKRQMLQKTQREGCHILVATPGRLNDLLNDPYSKMSAPNLGFFVLDEADRMLDAGFSDEIREIMKKLPDRKVRDRQTLLFSATVPREVMGLVRATLKHDFKFMQTVQKGEVETHHKVPQKLSVVNGMENLIPTILELAKREVEKHSSSESALPFKAIIYYNATAMVDLSWEIFMNLRSSGGQHPLRGLKIFKINAKMTQESRTKSAERFRLATSGILISTDVTARGMDFPNVSHVIQAGLPSDRQQYIHRIGRTGRGDKQGEAWLMAVKDYEEKAVPRFLPDLPIVRDNSLEIPTIDMTRDAQVPDHVAATLREVSDASKEVDRSMKASAYIAALGIFSAFGMRKVMRISDYLASLNQLSVYGWGMEKPPFISPTLAQKMGMRASDGVNIGRDDSFGRSDSPARGGFSRSNSFDGDRSSRYGGDREASSFSGRERGGFSRGGSSYGSSDRDGFSGGGRGGFSRGGSSFGSRGSDRDAGGFSGRGRGGFSRGGSSYGSSDRDAGGFSSRGRGGYGSGDRDGFSGGGRGGFSRGGSSFGSRGSDRGGGGFSSRGRGGFSSGGRGRDSY